MPILPREPDLFPETLLSDEHRWTQGDAQWWAIYTMSRREKDLMRRLTAMEIPFCAPLVKRRTRSASGRTRTSHVPLFAGYVFLLGDNDQRQQALTTNCVSKCLAVPDPEILVRDLFRIKQLIDSDVPLTPEAKLTTGAPVRVVSGVLAGVEGVVIQRRGREHLLVAVEFLQQGASVLLEDVAVEPVS